MTVNSLKLRILMQDFKRPLYTNNLTAKISKGDATLTDVLLSEELLDTVRNEAIQLLNFFFPPEEMEKKEPNLENLDKLIDLSLKPDKKLKKKYRLYQLNRNAANVLSNPSAKFQQKLCEDKSKRYFRRLRNFMIEGGEVRRDHMFSGHFTRMFEVALRYSGETLLDTKHTINYNDEFTEEKFLKFIIENSENLSYCGLLQSIMEDFTKYFPTVFVETLRYSAIATLHINEKNQLFNSAPPVFESESDSEVRIKFILDNQPKNCHKETVPIPFYLDKKDEIEYEPNQQDIDEKFIEYLKKNLGFNEVKEKNIFLSQPNRRITNSSWVRFALNLIYAFKHATESTQIIPAISEQIKKDEKDKKDNMILLCLLTTGVFADSQSSLSYTSFNLLFDILNKPHHDADDNLDGKYILRLDPPEIVDKFAEHFIYDPFDVTETMISSLLVFWNHRYKEVPNIKQKKGGVNVLPNYKTKSGVTPLELLLPTILTEPIYSSKLNNIFIRIISSLEQEIIDNIEKAKTENTFADKNSKSKSKTTEKADKRCFKLDSIWYELLTYEFKLSPKDEEYITLIKALEKLLPLPTTDSFYHEMNQEEEENDENKPKPGKITDKAQILFRATTNPIFFMLSNIINHGAFFSYKEGCKFRELFTAPIDKEWAFNSFTYYHIIDKLKKEIVQTPFRKIKIKKRVIDEIDIENNRNEYGYEVEANVNNDNDNEK